MALANITTAIDAGDYVGAYLVWDAFLNGDAHPGGAWFANVTGGVNYYNIATDMSPALDWYTAYVTSAAVRTAIGVGAQQPYADGNPLVEQALQGDVMFSQRPQLESLLQQGYNVLVYNGALDLICGAPLTERYMNVLQWVGAAQWLATPRSPWLDADGSGAVSGYSRSAQNLAQVVMRGAGHLAPFDQPRRSLDLITRFVSGRGYMRA